MPGQMQRNRNGIETSPGRNTGLAPHVSSFAAPFDRRFQKAPPRLVLCLLLSVFSSGLVTVVLYGSLPSPLLFGEDELQLPKLHAETESSRYGNGQKSMKSDAVSSRLTHQDGDFKIVSRKPVGKHIRSAKSQILAEGGDVINDFPRGKARKGNTPEAIVRGPLQKKPSKEARQAFVADGNGKEPILRQLRRAGVEVTESTLISISDLPTWSSVVELYGPNPVINGLDTCSAFRNAVPLKQRIIAPAGLHNSGTNLMSKMLEKNCYIPGGETNEHPYGPKSGIQWQVPWGKHTPAFWRNNFVAEAGGAGVNHTNVLPVVMIRDPYYWMTSMCRDPYEVKWRAARHCPNLVDDEEQGNATNGVAVRVVYKAGNVTHPGNITHHDSLVHLWNDWYVGYRDAIFPRLIVRFEDVLFHPEHVMEKICTCAGGSFRVPGQIQYVVGNAKPDSRSVTDMIYAMKMYGRDKTRYNWFRKADMDYARLHLRDDLVPMNGYTWPPPSTVLSKYMMTKYKFGWPYILQKNVGK